MKKYLFITLLFIISYASFSQEKVLDSAYLKCQYEHTYLKDTLDISTKNDLLILQIGENLSKSYSYYTFQIDSLVKTPDGDKVWKEIFDKSLKDWKIHRDRSKWMNSFPRVRNTTYVYKNYPAGSMTITDRIGSDRVIYEDNLNAQNWQITDSVKIVLGYECQQASCNFRGRQWVAWFTTDVPVSDGPWKLGGLPGLIMEAYDTGKHYSFTMIGLEKVTEEPIVFTEPSSKKNKYKKVARKEFLKARMHKLSNSASYMAAESGISFGEDDPVYRDLIERDYK